MRFVRLRDPESYVPALWDLRTDAAARRHWSAVFRAQLRSMVAVVARFRDRGQARLATEVGERFDRFLAELDPPTLDEHPHVHAWTGVRERLIDEVGLDDPYAELKAAHDEAALAALPAALDACRSGGSQSDVLRLALAAVIAGNRLDMGSPTTAGVAASGAVDFAAEHRAVAASAWLFDGFPAFDAVLDAVGADHRTVLILVDNSGYDFVCGVAALATTLAERGFDVVLAANQRPSLNDVTAAQARRVLARAAALDERLGAQIGAGAIAVVSTGTGSPGIDLRHVSAELDDAGRRAGLLVLVGQGRAAETNWHARFDLPVLRVLTLKDTMVAARLGGRPFDAVCAFTPGRGGLPAARRGADGARVLARCRHAP